MNATSVVIGVDFSPAMSHCGEWIRKYIAPHASITLVHAYEPSPLPPFLDQLLPHEPAPPRREARQLELALQRWREQNGIRDAFCIVRAAPAYELIRKVAREVHADLIVIGARTASDRPWLRLGSTAERLLRSAHASLLVVHGRPRAAPRKLLVAVDDVTITPYVLGIAGDLADRFDAPLHAVHVLSNAAYSHVLSAEAATAKNEEEAAANVARDIAAESLHWLRDLWSNTLRHDRLEAEVPHGIPGAEILKAAARSAAELIVIGRYGAGRVLPAVLGSVVGSVVHGATCPVLVVSEDREDEEDE